MSPGAPAPTGFGLQRSLLLAAQRGDHRAEEELLRRFEPLVRRTVRSLSLPARCPSEDMLQEARLALASAIRAWEPRRGTFAAFAEICLQTKTANALAATSRLKDRPLNDALSLDAVAGPDDDRPADDVLPSPARSWKLSSGEDVVAQVFVREELDRILAALPTLTGRERAVLAGVLNDRSYRQVADEIGCRTKGVDRALSRARRKLASPQTAVARPARRHRTATAASV